MTSLEFRVPPILFSTVFSKKALSDTLQKNYRTVMRTKASFLPYALVLSGVAMVPPSFFSLVSISGRVLLINLRIWGPERTGTNLALSSAVIACGSTPKTLK
jgi:hypothetical protein